MNKIVRSYFLFFSRNPLGFSFIIFIIAIAIFLLIGVKIQGNDYYLDVSIKIFGILIILGILNLIAVNIVTKKKITRYFEDDSFWFRGVVSNGVAMVIDKPLWLKGDVYEIKKPFNFANYRYFRHYQLDTTLTIRHELSEVVVPVKIFFNISDKDVRLEIFEAIFKERFKLKDLSFDGYLLHVFNKSNDTKSEIVQDIVARYVSQEISTATFLSELIQTIKFPEKIFSNVTGLRTRLYDPKIFSCKGDDCEN